MEAGLAVAVVATAEDNGGGGPRESIISLILIFPDAEDAVRVSPESDGGCSDDKKAGSGVCGWDGYAGVGPLTSMVRARIGSLGQAVFAIEQLGARGEGVDGHRMGSRSGGGSRIAMAGLGSRRWHGGKTG